MREGAAVQIAVRDEASAGYDWLRRPRRLLAILDGLAAGVALLALRGLIEWRIPADPAATYATDVGISLVLLLTLILGFRNGQYTTTRRLSRFADVGALATHLAVAASAVSVFAILTKGFFLGSVSPSRLVLCAALAIFFLLAASSRVVLAMRQRSMFLKGAAFRRVLVLGSGSAGREFVDFVAQRPWLGVACVGRLTYEPSATLPSQRHHGDQEVAASLSPTLAGFEDLDRVWCASGASEVVVALDARDHELLPGVTKLLALAHVPFRVVPSLFEPSYASTDLLGYGEIPVIDVDVDPLDRVERLFKRALDLIVSSLLLLLGSLAGLVLVVAIKLDSPGPLFYMQERVGKNGRHFLMYKFRSMVSGAEEMLEELKDMNEKGAAGRIFKMKEDPRITRVGRLLRKWSLDELPQIINVFKGEMSLVGPRPPLPEEVDTYEEEHYCRLKGLPGITGLWQVSGRSNLSFEQMVKLDKYYLEHWSIRLDLSIMLKTVLVVLARRGAY